MPVGDAPLESSNSASIPILDSLPGADASLFLDFDGHQETSWGTFQDIDIPAYDIDGDPTSFNDAEVLNMIEIWRRVAEDYAPFNINVTTVEEADDSGAMLRVAIGGDGAWSGAVNGGISYVGLYSDPATPHVVFIFPDNLGNGNARLVAETASHEAGHAFGLDHQCVYDADGHLVNEYNPGDFQRAPIMGDASASVRSVWWYGPTDESPDTMQDDMEVIAANSFGWRPDEVGDTANDAEPLDAINQFVSGAGVIEKMTDVDVWSFETDEGFVMFHVSVPTGINNLDVKIQLLDADGNAVISWQDPAVSFDAMLTGYVAEGSYRLVVASHGAYGDVGQYLINGVILPPGSTLAPPTDLLAVGVGPNQIELAWTDNANDESGYVVQRSYDGASWETVATLEAGADNLVDQGLSPGSAYFYRVYAQSGLSTSPWSNIAEAMTWPAQPLAPTALQATAQAFDQIHLAWLDRADNETGYVVERAKGDGQFVTIALLPADSVAYDDIGLDQNTAYEYRVHAVNRITASEHSNLASKSTLPAVPAAPGDLQVTAVGTHFVRLAWTDHATVATSMVIERSTNGLNWKAIATLPAGSTSYEDADLPALMPFQYRVRAVNDGVDSGYSSVAAGRTLPEPPDAPIGIKAVTFNRALMKLSWLDVSSNELYFKVLRSTDGVNWTAVGYTLANVRTIKVAKPPRGASYYYSVVAVNHGGESAPSATVAVRYNSILARAAMGYGSFVVKRK